MRRNIHWKILAGLLAMSGIEYSSAGDMGALTEGNPSGWQGFYIGGQVGGAKSNQEWHYNNPNFFNTLGSKWIGNNFEFNPSSFIGGGYAGFNYQLDTPWLVGLEGSFSGTDLNSSKRSPFFLTDLYTSNMNQLGTLRGRLGYNFDQWLPFISGGWAIANTSLTLSAPGEAVRAETSTWNNGWIIGLGVEYRVTQNVSVGVVYDYSKIYINKEAVNCPACGIGVGLGTPVIDGNFKTQTLMARLSYLING